MTTVPQMPAEMHPQRRLGHVWRVTVQERFGQTDAIDHDKRVWIGCTCGWWPSPHYPTVDDAVEAFFKYHRPDDRPAQPLHDGDDTGGRGAAEDSYMETLMDGHR